MGTTAPPLSDVSEMYGLAYQADSVAEERKPSWAWIAHVLDRRFSPRSTMDVGAGAGPLVRAFRERGKDAWGIEGSRFCTLEGERIFQHDLREPLPEALPFSTFDLVTCSDTAEHVEEGGYVVDICVQLAKNWIVFGAATPDQDGHGHCHLRSWDHWHSEFANRGWDLDREETAGLMAHVESNDIHAKVWWWRRNGHVYRRRS